ncbi:MAG: DegV family protein [Chloroflexi bacterium]|nr:DegV family protein [Chloroflexota bacterium]
MAIRIVTDSSADLPAKLAKDLGITVVPLYVRFGEKVYRDRVDITEDEFYQRLARDPVHPSTIQPSPQDFATAYQKLQGEADGIVSIHISSKLSGTYNSAAQAKEEVGKKCPIEVVDSGVLSMALGFIVLAAARTAKAGGKLADVVAEVKTVMPAVHLLGLLDTLKYVLLGGRIGKAKALVGSILNVKPVLTLRDGEVMPAGQVRSRTKGIERLFDFAKGVANVEETAVMYNTTPDEAQVLSERLGKTLGPERIIIARIGPMLGVHMGPGALIAVVKEKVS